MYTVFRYKFMVLAHPKNVSAALGGNYASVVATNSVGVFCSCQCGALI